MPVERDDLSEIRDLLARYCSHLDRSEHPAWIELFTTDGRFEVYGTAFVGPEGLRQMAETAPGGLHLTGDALVEVEGDRATVKQSFLFVDQATRETRIGFYDDLLARTPDGWRIEVRRSTFLTPNGPADRPTGRRYLQDVITAIARFDALLDGQEIEAWLELFCDDAVLEVGGKRLQSSDARRELALATPRGRHLTSLPVVTGNLESGRVHASSTFLLLGLDGTFVQMGGYDDDLVYQKGAWRFAHRSIDLLGEPDTE